MKVKTVQLGSIITRSDNKKYIITVPIDAGFSTEYEIPKDVNVLPIEYGSAKYLLGKTVGQYFYKDGIGNFKIVNIESSPLEELFRMQNEKRERIERERLQEEERREKAYLEELKREQELEKRRKAALEEVREWFSQHVTDQNGKEIFDNLDDEQIAAIIDESDNTLVSARAGSGKTTTIVAKIVYLIKKKGYKPQELIAFVFNKDARKEINRRLEKIWVDDKKLLANSEIAYTFHSFAKKIVYDVVHERNNTEKILCDDDEFPTRTYFIQAIIRKISKKKLYAFFRDEMFQIDKQKFASENDFFESLRSSNYETLDGKIVKSKAEKIICDYLFEHDIKYYYENEYYLRAAYSVCKKEYRNELYRLKNDFGEESTKPDFVLLEYNIPWEHWAITGEESRLKIEEINNSGVIGDYDRYKRKMYWKRWFYKKEWVDYSVPAGKYAQQIRVLEPLIETTIDGDETREQFEERIQEILESRGIYKDKLPEDELINRVWNSQITRFSKMITQFIDRAELNFPNELDLLEKVIANADVDARTGSFLEIALDCYKKYLAYLSGELPKYELRTKISRKDWSAILDFEAYVIDFSLLLQRANKLMNDNASGIAEMLQDKRYIFIDEYQDFSRLFFQSIQAVRSFCEDAKIFAVGDDWQAINSFAGSDLEYFDNFESYFGEDSARLSLSTNYRSGRNIVNAGKSFMRNSLQYTDRVFSNPRNGSGMVKIIDPSETDIDYKGTTDDAYKEAMMNKDRKNPSKASVQMLKTVSDIIAKNPGKEIMILHRNNNTSFWFLSLAGFSKRLKNVLACKNILPKEEYDKNVSCRTMHKSKGLQADVVIILEADEGIIPSFHQNIKLYSIFGDTEEKVLAEQKRLFYVAMTRARQKLYILHTSNPGHDGFISFLQN